ncbi:MAG: hypothetical protein B0D96_01280 [Candidatus Sedimenticola endophacoides]|uniref:Guanylate cyclase domain-containing protein n=2 Tax=Candidatus Sedimenticola endophacoides TaxID=2548426 RepID=A0A657Q7K7_9GAMM|nr:MAG: hypothetical protein B0D94_04585 [Candidatus Sedimenticola endophacoides]OQX37767.1 MAG: hypothetical protein B0D96_01280 [Candidatus Sedimenticola endophacoides]OQX41412.1 MAG: hypothetical protein B0D89_04160 [Candidatus Sedimenticola endophacoides]OQX41929.1 MAG: hypothetical protein B0D82_01795 [Candidatus Sedimenticola endophacoides]OQX46159.1 MAG: hypothetical protein B0D86_02130 [Candidatus Sedimenticola endophacoides]
MLNSLPRGIDNIHVDVLLSSEFTGRAELLVRHLMQYDIAVNYWGESPVPPKQSDLNALLNAYSAMMEGALQQASKTRGVELIQLLQFSVVKFLLQQVRTQFRAFREQVKSAGSPHGEHSTTQSVRAHERLVVLSRQEPTILYRINQYLFRELFKLENARLSKLRKSLLGSAWPVHRAVLFNPVLTLPSLWVDELLIKHYTPLAFDRNDPDRFARINRLVLEPFASYLPDCSQPRQTSGTEADRSELVILDNPGQMRRSMAQVEIERILRPALRADEFERGQGSWLDVPENIDLVLYGGMHEDEGERQKWDKYRAHLRKQIYNRFKRNGLEQEIMANHAAASLYGKLEQQLPVRLIGQYLSGAIKRKDMQRRLSTMQSVKDAAQVLPQLDAALSALRSTPVELRQKRVFSFLRHFVQLRRDLKLGYQAHLAMGQIRLLTEANEITLSSNNKTLHHFSSKAQTQGSPQTIRNHVILKADVRGSTAMISKLRSKDLNPATHFSLNFFDPITKLLAAYGAKKVFVEGDAVILSVFEYEDTPYQWMCVSHACGLAVDILRVIDRQNTQNRKYGLPPLELGLGIAFSDQPPTFLYDGEQQIMISPAINRSDQLSSCSSALRKSPLGKGLGRGVEVYVPIDQSLIDKQTSDRLVRYNVNGIELDAPAFYKLKSELVLREAEADATGRYLVGRFPDLEGRMHGLVVREAMVLNWDGARAAGEESRGRRFYEVIADQTRIRSLLGREV